MKVEKNFSDMMNEELRGSGLMPTDDARRRELLLLKEKRAQDRTRLPHLYRYKFYTWAREFFESQEKINLLCAANQLGKSSIQIRKCIEWATNKNLWQFLWTETPNQFWYLYPTSKQAKIEFETKWKQFLPAGDYKHHPDFGWKEEWVNRELFAIHFNSGVHVYFKFYSQSAEALQTGTVHAMFCDEELPVELFDELMFRLTHTEGYFHMVFTATMGQDFWRLCMEPNQQEVEKLPQAKKWTVSLWNSQKYEDGSDSPWLTSKIQSVEAKCSTDSEIQKRVYGRFIRDDAGGRTYEQYNFAKHFVPAHPLPETWSVYAGVDIGSGGDAHPSSICFVAVSPDMRLARVIAGWRGDGVPTTASDVVQKYLSMKKQIRNPIVAQYYDWANPDFAKIALDMGEPFLKADKNHEKGEAVINVLFKNDLMFIYESDELAKLSQELSSLYKSTPKRKAKDDFADALRYALSQVPFDFSGLIGKDSDYREPVREELTYEQKEMLRRRGLPVPGETDQNTEAYLELDREFDEANDFYG